MRILSHLILLAKGFTEYQTDCEYMYREFPPDKYNHIVCTYDSKVNFSTVYYYARPDAFILRAYRNWKYLWIGTLSSPFISLVVIIQALLVLSCYPCYYIVTLLISIFTLQIEEKFSEFIDTMMFSIKNICRAFVLPFEPIWHTFFQPFYQKIYYIKPFKYKKMRAYFGTQYDRDDVEMIYDFFDEAEVKALGSQTKRRLKQAEFLKKEFDKLYKKYGDDEFKIAKSYVKGYSKSIKENNI